ncbi:hypothetical protein LCGC14_0443750 [marine sediment metagenome]|uniref:HTH marR-type domain-containing protein n=1 Tax=marine sediment metagenome TaxID=412755 RepID=A0A0F9SQJ8_9ZZZZ
MMIHERREYLLQRLRGAGRWQTRDALIPEGHWTDFPYPAVGALLRELVDAGTVERRDDGPSGRYEYRVLPRG